MKRRYVQVVDGDTGVFGPVVVIADREYSSVYAAEHVWRLARRATRNPLRKLLATAVLLELKSVEL